MRQLVIFGATSKIAHEIAKLAAADRVSLVLVGRNPERVLDIAADLRARGATSVQHLFCDLADTTQHPRLFDDLDQIAPGYESILLIYGTLGDQNAGESSSEEAVAQMTTNFVSCVGLLTEVANHLEKIRAGLIAVVTSVAGDRARCSNYIYGTAKGALALFCQGLRARLFHSGVRVLTIKPGPVDTPMTAGMKLPLMVPADKVARQIYREMKQGSRETLYAPAIWRPIMFLIRSLPETIAKRLKL